MKVFDRLMEGSALMCGIIEKNDGKCDGSAFYFCWSG